MMCFIWTGYGYTAMAYAVNLDKAREMLDHRVSGPFQDHIRNDKPDEIRSVPFAMVATGTIR